MSDSADQHGQAGGLDQQQQDLLDLLKVEIADIVEVKAQAFEGIKASPDRFENIKNFLSGYAMHAENIGKAAEVMGLTGLQTVCAFVFDSLTAFAAKESDYNDDELYLIENWPEALLAYLQNIQSRENAESLAGFVMHPSWSKPYSGAPDELLQSLLSSNVEKLDESVEPRKTQAFAEDVSLQIPGDVNKELLHSVLQELPSQSAEFSEAVFNVLQKNDISELEKARRAAHTLKGVGNLVGIAGIANLTHHLEDILEVLYKSGTMPPESLKNLLFQASDCVEAMSEAVLGQSSPPDDAVMILQEILNWANRIDEHGAVFDAEAARGDVMPAAGEATVESHQSAPQAEAVNAAGPEDMAVAGSAGTQQPDQQADQQADQQEGQSAQQVSVDMLRIPTELADDLLRVSSEGLITASQIEDKVKLAIKKLQLIYKQSQTIQKIAEDFEQLVDVKGFMKPLQKTGNGDDFDPLEFDQYNELHTLTHQLQEACVDAKEMVKDTDRELTVVHDKSLGQLNQIREGHELALRTQMVSADTVLSRLKRNVRQVCRLTNKNAELTVIGGEELLDGRLLNKLVDPLMHIIRNAVDHGIEPSDVRQQKGKPPEGNITVEFKATSDNVIISCMDDGGGFNLQQIKTKAVEKGLIDNDIVLSENDLLQLTLHPGFSTKSQASQISGRGIGMDVVNNSIKELKGSINIKSREGEGTTIQLVLPVRLSLSNVLLVQVSRHVLAVSNLGVEQILFHGVGKTKNIDGALHYDMEGQIYPAYYLKSLLNMEDSLSAANESASIPLMIKDEDNQKSIVFVEKVLDSRECVIKPLGFYIPKINGVVGAAVLGDGSTTPVMDLNELVLHNEQSHMHSIVQDQITSLATSDVADEAGTYALVVDDSLSARQSLAEFIEDIGLEVKTAKDGFEAIQIIENQKPSIILADLEMPRMNGLELTTHVKSQTQLKSIPVVMITSRSTEKHIEMAKKTGVEAYLTKPYSENELMDVIMQYSDTG